jgi:Chaperonin 10 Kd subunit
MSTLFNIPIDLKAGDRVLFGKWSGTEVKIDGEELLIMKESDVRGCSKAPWPAGRPHSLALTFHQFNLGEPKWLPRTLDFQPPRETRCCMASMFLPTLSE